MTETTLAPVRRGEDFSAGGDAFFGSIAELPSISLAELIEQAELQHRVDRKYVLAKDVFAHWLGMLGRNVRALEIDGRRSFGYESIYFDTPDLLTFRQHRQGRRRRYKIRTRTYIDSGDCTFEVKLEGHRGATIKERQPHPVERRAELTGSAMTQLAAVLGGHDLPVPAGLEPVQRLFYRRSTLFVPDVPARITCDVHLSYRSGEAQATGPDDQVIVEVKSATGRNHAVTSLTGLGVRPVQISKYCVGTALLTGANANRWHPVIKRYFRTC